MDNQPILEIFCFKGREVRFVGTSDIPEWVANDIVDVFNPLAKEQRSYHKYLEKVPSKWKLRKSIPQPDGSFKEMDTLLEPGLYFFINRSESSVAVPFQEWLYEDVIPSIRKTGSYSIKNVEPPALLSLQERRQRLEIIQLGMDIIGQLGGIDDRTQLAFKDLAKNIVLEEQLKKPALPSGGRFEWPVSDRVAFLGYGTANKGYLQRIGKAAAKLYRARYNVDPPKREQFVDGATREVNCYEEKDLEILDSAIRAVMSPPVQPDNVIDNSINS